MKRPLVFGAAIFVGGFVGGCGAILGLSEREDDPPPPNAEDGSVTTDGGLDANVPVTDGGAEADAPLCTSTNEPNNCGACGRRCNLDAGCTNGKCQRRIAFLTKEVFRGNAFGGTGADALCRALAQDAGLSSGTWKVWLGGNRFNEQLPQPVHLPSGERVADKWPPGQVTLAHAINVDPTGDEIGGQNVRAWTDLDSTGSLRSVNNCLGWEALNPGNQQGGYGEASRETAEWTVGLTDGPDRLCTEVNHLYCIEDP